MDVEEVDCQLQHWRVALRAARFASNTADIIEAETAIDELLDERLQHDLEANQASA